MKKRICFVGVGGQGTLLASRLLGEAVMKAGYDVRVSEVHGMAQRGGVVESTVMTGGIKSPVISKGMADILISTEPVETLRALDRCNIKTTIITNIDPIEPVTVKLGLQKYPEVDEILKFIKDRFQNTYALDATSIAKEAGTAKAANIVLLGVLIGLNILDISKDLFIETIKERIKPKFIEANLKAFELGLNSVA